MSGAGREKELGSYVPVPQTDKGGEVTKESERGARQLTRQFKGKEGTKKEKVIEKLEERLGVGKRERGREGRGREDVWKSRCWQ